MTNDFRKRLEIQSHKLLHPEPQATIYGKHFRKYTKHRTRIKEAMFFDEQGKVMRECFDNNGPACGSIFCDKCLDKRQRNLYATYKQYYEKHLNGNEDLARERLRWITILHSLVRVKVDTMENEEKTVLACVDAANKVKQDIRNMARSKKVVWLRGAIHAELIDYSLYEYFVLSGGGTEKEKTLSAFIKASGESYKKEGLFADSEKELFVLVHFHALADIGDASDKDIRQFFTKRYNLINRQVDISRLWEVVKAGKAGGVVKHKIDDALRGMARYCYSRSNSNLTYSQDWGAGERIHTITHEYDLKQGIRTIAVMERERDIDKDITLSVGEVRLLVKVHNAISGTANEGLNIYIHRKDGI